MKESIKLHNVRVNNLKNISIDIPRDKFVVVAGVSGSGKSSLAFDTLYAEGQRRYVESLSSYARQFLGRLAKPECDFIKGLPPAIAIEQKVIARNPRSTVGTTTEIYEYLKLLFARIGRTFSPISGCEVKKHSTDDIVETIGNFSAGTRYAILAPLNITEGRTLEKQLDMEMQAGFSRLYAKGEFYQISDFRNDKQLMTTDVGNIFLLIDRLIVDMSKDGISRLIDSAETAFYEGNGACRIVIIPSGIKYDFSNRFEADGMRFEEPTDNMFSFNSPMGACPVCEGFGKIIGIDEKLVIPNTTLSVYDGCVQCWRGDKMGMWKDEFCRRAAIDGFPIFTPYYELSQKHKDMLWHGLPSDARREENDRVSIDNFFKMVKENQYKIQYRVMLSRFRGKTVCPECHGTRLRKETNWVKVGGKSLSELVEIPIKNLTEWFDDLNLTDYEEEIVRRPLLEIKNRLRFINEVGLGYLTLNRPSNTLSGGESQRINLTTSLGSTLVGSMYILDEPSIGLHSRDTNRLISVLKKLRDEGNSVIVVEHDPEIIRASDYLIDIGPDAGEHGGEIVFSGETQKISEKSIEKYHDSHTIAYLYGKEKILTPKSRRPWNLSITLKGARMNNLKGIDVEIPLNVITVVTGVSGSGKSSLISGTLFPAMKRRLDEVADLPGEYLSIEGDADLIKHVEFVDQSPIGKSTRSNPATYIKAFDLIRQLYADQPLSKQMGFTPQFFSFNADGGRCEECNGAGVINVEMQFMADITLVCESCHGKRFKKDILDVTFCEKNIDDILNMTITEAVEFFSDNGQKLIANRLKPLVKVGLGYIKMGQSSSSLSGGENQRVKLASFIGQENQSPTLFMFDEPTTGLHPHDISLLLEAFNSLIEKGHTILIVEHNLDIIKNADYVIDLGPEGGDKGGNIVCCGTPEQIAKCPESYTGKYLAKEMFD